MAAVLIHHSVPQTLRNAMWTGSPPAWAVHLLLSSGTSATGSNWHPEPGFGDNWPS